MANDFMRLEDWVDKLWKTNRFHAHPCERPHESWLNSRNGEVRSMDGRGRALDNVCIERLWRTVKYEEVYVKDYETPREAIEGLATFFVRYNERRQHQSLDYRTPAAVYFNSYV